MSPMTIHSVPGSPFLASVLWALEERGAPYELVPLAAGETRQPGHLARHPFGRMPTIEHDGFALYETQAILRYIADAFPGEPLVPAATRDRARMNQQIGINDWYFFPKVASIVVFERLIKPHLTGQPADEGAVRGALPMASLCVREIERLMEGRHYLAGDHLSLADLHVAPQMYYLAMTPEGASILKEHAQLSAWLALMTSRPTIRKTTLSGVGGL
jgi:glutathione S-transferase